MILVLGIFLNAFSSALSGEATPIDLDSSVKGSLAIYHAVQKGIAALERYTPARVGDRTIMDTLQPFCSGLLSSEESNFQTAFTDAVRAARYGADGTRGMAARLGRATYLSVPLEEMPPDPGAWGICAILEGMIQGLQKTHT